MNPQRPLHPNAALRGDNSATHSSTHEYYYQNYNAYNNHRAPANQHISAGLRPPFQGHIPPSNPHVLVHPSLNNNNNNHHHLNRHVAPRYNHAPFLTPPIATKQTNHSIIPIPPPHGVRSATTFNNLGTTNFIVNQPPIFRPTTKPNTTDIAEAFINQNLKHVNQRTAASTKSPLNTNLKESIQPNSKYVDQNCGTKSLEDKMLDFVSNNFVHLKKLPRSDSRNVSDRSPEHRSIVSRSRSRNRYYRNITKSPSPVRKTSVRPQDQLSSKSCGRSSTSPPRKSFKDGTHDLHNDKNYKDKSTKSRSRSPSCSRSRFSRRLSRSQSPGSRSRSRSKFSRRLSRSRSPHRSHQNVSARSQVPQKLLKNDSRSHHTKSRSRSPSSCKTPQDRYHNSKERHRQGNAKFTEREELLLKYKKDYCPTISAIQEKLSNINEDLEDFLESKCWLRDTPAELYYLVPDPLQPNEKQSSKRLDMLCDKFDDVLIKRADRCRSTLPKYDIPVRKKKVKLAKHKCEHSEHSSDESTDSSSSSSDEEYCTMQELQRKKSHPLRLHPELWFNDKGEMNDGPLCRCSAKARRSGIRHNIYAGENNLPKCSLNTNNVSKLHHYRITISPPTNFLIKTPTIIPYDNHEYIFEGFSMFSHKKLDKLPACKVIRFNIEYTILYFEEETPKNFTIRELDMFHDYLFQELLELVDLDFKGAGGDQNRCSQFHFMPRFVRELSENGKEILSMNEVLKFLLENSNDLVKEADIDQIPLMKQSDWEKEVDKVKGMIVTKPAMKPCALRIDQLDRDPVEGKTSPYPEIVHFGIRPPQLSYAGNPEYQKAWREYVKFRHLLANMPKPSYADKRKLEVKENQLQQMRTWTKMKRDVTITVNSDGFKKTGIMCDIVQHAMLIPVLVSHLRFHRSLDVLEETIQYKFENRYLLQLALTHPSYRENFGTNPDHARNSLTNCGIRQPEYGDRRIHYMNTRKRGINTLINIMSRFGKKKETESNITHNERLEFLGDAVVEFITSIHLFHMFPQLEEGGLATYRAAVVQNQHLAELAKTLKLDEYMLYAHGSDLCHELELRHAMANCFEALMGALFLDGGIEVADKVFGETFFTNKNLLDVWVNYPPHPLQEQEPVNDRHWISKFEILQKLTKFEESIGVEFTHIRLLARAFTDRSMGFTHLTLGSNQRLEFLGDTVLQLIASEYLYKYYPEHHEGHLSLLRSSLVNNRTQAVVCNDLGMTTYALYSNPKAELKTKDRADLLEAFLGALYIDKGMDHCKVFCNVCFFPRLQTSIMKQDWNDPKSKLQQCCLTLRTMEGGEPEIPVYKVIECMGPTNGRVFTVAVYFKGRRLAKATGNSIQQAEMNSAKKALQQSHNLFPQLDHQKRVIAKSLSQHPPRRRNQVKKNFSNPNRRPLRDKQ